MDPELSRNVETYAPALGRLIMACSKLETELTNLIAATTNMHIVHAVMTVHHQQFASKADTLLAILNVVFEDDQEFEPILTMISQAKTLGEYRNTLVHAIWLFDDKGLATTTRFTARGKLTRSRHPVKLSEIDGRAREAFALAEKLEEFRKHLQEPEETPRV